MLPEDHTGLKGRLAYQEHGPRGLPLNYVVLLVFMALPDFSWEVGVRPRAMTTDEKEQPCVGTWHTLGTHGPPPSS